MQVLKHNQQGTKGMHQRQAFLMEYSLGIHLEQILT